MDEKKDNRQQESVQYKEKLQKEFGNISAPELLKSGLDELQPKIGVDSFDFLSNLIEGLENMNPDKKARKKIFMSEKSRKKDRKDFSKKLKLWVDVLSSEADLYGMVENCEKAYQESKQLYDDNLGTAVETTKELEQAYRTAYLFFRNTEE